MCPGNPQPSIGAKETKHFDVSTCNPRQLYQLLTGGVVPRPIAWHRGPSRCVESRALLVLHRREHCPTDPCHHASVPWTPARKQRYRRQFARDERMHCQRCQQRHGSYDECHLRRLSPRCQ
ncbi:hypothetical protein Ae201684_006100 [Aphanomyces euteiches]|uniref:Uncharacterized protein n=1 Tax=Aphanomyces euteiches TaxID=100861 RepID=A0A6G0XD27_9STRA|nr:hypothetical protein Ae201684_006100 [Aphanomyces euteiches]